MSHSRRIALLTSGTDTHSLRWANGLAGRGLDVHVISQHPFGEGYVSAVGQHRLPHSGAFGYYRNVGALRRLCRELEIDLLHAHYASGYGTLARRSRIHPCLLSVWGSDVFEVPERSGWHRRLVLANLHAADRLSSTGEVMAERVRTLSAAAAAKTAVIPFGVETDRFQPSSSREAEPLVIGTVKKLEPVYGIDLLIEAYALLLERLRSSGFATASLPRLRIVGEGSQRPVLEARIESLGLGELVSLPGAIPHADVPAALAALDIFVAASRAESFGVSVLEAGACGLPVVVSRVGGLPEIVREGETGLLVEAESVSALEEALARMVREPHLRAQLGAAGRRHVQENYEWSSCLDRMQALYEEM